jgi:hypothetical protein
VVEFVEKLRPPECEDPVLEEGAAQAGLEYVFTVRVCGWNTYSAPRKPTNVKRPAGVDRFWRMFLNQLSCFSLFMITA